MAEVTWFKVLTDIFSDDKIKILQSMPEGDSLLVMWFKVLAQAGKTNDGGYIYLKKNIPYTNGMLATLFGKQQQLVELAMRTFSEFGMIDIDDNGYVFVTNWEKHQSIEKLDRIREKTRLRVSEHRQKKKLELMDGNVTVTPDVTHANATEIDIDLELERTTTATENLTVNEIYTKVFNLAHMNGLMSDYIRRVKAAGYTDAFIKELLLETGQFATKPSLEYMQSIGDRWMKEGIFTRIESAKRKEKLKIVPDKPQKIDKELEQRNAEMAFNQFVTNGGNPSDYRTASGH
jgi:predicted phage replisome organizer